MNKVSVILHPQSPDGGTGRRVRLKIWYSQGCAGSIPVLGTRFIRFQFYIESVFVYKDVSRNDPGFRLQNQQAFELISKDFHFNPKEKN